MAGVNECHVAFRTSNKYFTYLCTKAFIFSANEKSSREAGMSIGLVDRYPRSQLNKSKNPEGA
jgi:hypothetical protein